MRMFDRFLTAGALRPPREKADPGPLVWEGETFTDAPDDIRRMVDEHFNGDPVKANETLRRKQRENLREVDRLDREAARLDRKILDAFRTLASDPFMGVFLVDNVADYVAQFPVVDIYDLPCIAPARERSWFEWRGAGSASWRLGAWVDSKRTDDAWTVEVRLYHELRKTIIGPMSTRTFNLDERGRITDTDIPEIPEGTTSDTLPADYDGGEYLIVLHSLAFLHCRNVETDVLTTPPKLARKHEQRHGIGPTQFQTIRLRVPRKGGGGGSGEGQGDARSLHIVDGHFAHYGACCDNHPPHGPVVRQVRRRLLGRSARTRQRREGPHGSRTRSGSRRGRVWWASFWRWGGVMSEAYNADDLVTLWHGDCREVTEWLAADVLVTDPPYGRGWKGTGPGWTNSTGGGGHRSSGNATSIVNDHDTATRDEALTLWGPRLGAIFGDLLCDRPAGAVQVLVYAKPVDAGIMGARAGKRRDAEGIYLVGPWPVGIGGATSILTTGALVTGPRGLALRCGHPHAKPLDVLEDLIGLSGGVVADPFAGSGSTLVAAKRLGRRAIGVELDERYCEIAAKRLAQGVLDFGAAS